MICTTCDGRGIVTASLEGSPQTWDGEERRRQARWAGNDALKFREIQPAARYESCPHCEGSGRLHPNLLSV